MSAQGMDSGVLVALVTSSFSLLIAIVSLGFTAFRERQAREAAKAERREEREASAKAELDRVREPLLNAALDLAHRLDNIRHEYFLGAYAESRDDHRAKIARTSTLYRFARYWSIVESLYDRVALIQFRREPATASVADTLRDIGRTLASDKYDGGRFMVWREEQRAIAEKMSDDEAPLGCIGYATFVERYDETFAAWFASFDQDLEATTAVNSRRFEVLQRKLAELASQLDLDRVHDEQWQRLMANAGPAPTAAPSPR